MTKEMLEEKEKVEELPMPDCQVEAEEAIEMKDDGANSKVHGVEPIVSKNALKRKLRHEKLKAKWEEKKTKARDAKMKKRLERPPLEKELDMSFDAVHARREKQLIKRELFQMKVEEGYHVVIDCSFDDHMEEKHINSLSQQIVYAYGANRHSDNPMNTYLTSLSGQTGSQLTKVSGSDQWLAVHKTAKSYIDVFKKESLVYLTADSPNVLNSLSADKVYIIGGIVDRNKLKGATLKKAQEQGIQTARLPLSEAVDFGDSTRVLTVNHVYEILLNFKSTNDWSEAVLKAIPGRKGVQKK